MKTSIIINGQVGGNNKLSRVCQTIDSELIKLPFWCYEIRFRTKKEAVKALSDAFQYLRSNEPDFYKQGGISYRRGNDLHYDASHAEIAQT